MLNGKLAFEMYMYARALGSNANCTDLKIAEDGVTRVVS